MIGLVIVTHGCLADEFRNALEHVVGPLENVVTIGIGPQDDMEKRREDIAVSVSDVNAGAGVIILTDLFGGTPSNLAISLMETGRVEVIAGINLPMLVKLAKMRDAPLPLAVNKAQEAGRRYMQVASSLLATTDKADN